MEKRTTCRDTAMQSDSDLQDNFNIQHGINIPRMQTVKDINSESCLSMMRIFFVLFLMVLLFCH